MDIPGFRDIPTGKMFPGQTFANADIEQMSDTPRRGSHRRAQSEIFFRFPDDVMFDPENDFGLAGIDIPTMSEDNNSGEIIPMMTDSGKSEEERESGRANATSNHFRSFSVDDAFFEGLGFQSSGENGNRGGEVGKKGHRHSSSMDGSSSLESESIDAKKVMNAEKLAELALIDPKRAKRILANRQSAARSKERKIRYTGELERKVHTLQTEATTLSAQLTLLQRDTTGLTVENKELKLRLQTMEQHAHLRDALNEALREEVQRLKIVTGQIPSANGNSFNGGLPQPNSLFFSQSQRLHQSGGHQVQQQLHIPQVSPNGQTLSGQRISMDFMKGSSNHL